MPHCLETTLKPGMFDAEGESIRKKAGDWFGIDVKGIRVVRILTVDAELSEEQLQLIRKEVFVNPVTEISSYGPLAVDFHRMIWVGYRPGVKDNAGDTAVEAIERILNIRFAKGDGAYTSKRYCMIGENISEGDAEKIAGELLANDTIQRWKIYGPEEWNPEKGIDFGAAKVESRHVPEFAVISADSDETLKRISDARNLALHEADIPVIRAWFKDPEVLKKRAAHDLKDPTDVELEYISQARSDHCNHNTFQGIFRYRDVGTGETETINNLFNTCIKEPTLRIRDEKDWVISVLWDNAGVGRFDENHHYTITGETHNSPSNMEAYGGAITGIVGVYRDPMGTGKGSELVMGGYGFCTGFPNYDGPLSPRLHPRRLLAGVIEGVKDGGNKSGVPTTFGQVAFDHGYMGKCLVFVTAVGMMPAEVLGEPSHEKSIDPGDLAVMCGGRVGKDGIHGVTASSEGFSDKTPAGHVQIGDPYTQKKMHDFLLEARDEGFIKFITDNGGGGLSSSVGESARVSGGCRIELDRVPLKYEGLDPWEIWVSESQERMTVAVEPEKLAGFMELSAKHAVESTVMGEYTDTGMVHIIHDGATCAYVGLDLLTSGFPAWEFDAVWTPPEIRGLCEPVLGEPSDYNGLLSDIIQRPNICSKEWIPRQYDHEVRGGSVIKPLVGKDRDMPADASVICPVLESEKGLAFAQALIPFYSKIDAWHMTACTIDEAVRRVVAAGGDVDRIAGVDNFCWPSIGYDPVKNPDAKFKAAQLVRSCKALKTMCESYGIPLLSGKDSMYADGHLPGASGETHKVSALETMQFSALTVVEDVKKCITPDVKIPGDLVYILGTTKNELGGSEYYQHLGYTGLNVPRVEEPESLFKLYKIVAKAVILGIVASVHGVYRGGLGVHLAMTAMGGGLGMEIDLSRITANIDESAMRNDVLLFSESPGRFIVTVAPQDKGEFESLFAGLPGTCVGIVTEKPVMSVTGLRNEEIVSLDVNELKKIWKAPFAGF